MPHIIIEHSSNLTELTNMQALVEAVHQTALRSGLAEVSALRTRAAPRFHYVIADDDRSYGFVAIYARMAPAPSRDPEAIRKLLSDLINTVDEVLAPLRSTNPVAISAEAQMIDPDMRLNLNHIHSHLSESENI